MEAVYEQFFYLKYVGGWSFIEAYNLPVGLRNWFTDRLAEQLRRENEKAEEASRASGGGGRSTYELSSNGMNSMPPGVRSQMGRKQ
jgi:hypothetical protein